MWMWTEIIDYHKTSVAILLFLAVFSCIHFLKPSVLYKEDGSFRDFGVGYRNKTVFPIWLVAILLGISSYLLVCWSLTKIHDII